MLTINVSSNIGLVMDRLIGKAREQIPFATAYALTLTAKAAQADATASIARDFEQPTPFTMRAIAIKAARKSDLTAQVFVRPVQASYLGLEIAGGTLLPAKAARIVPVAVETVYGRSIPKGKVKALLARSDVFSGHVHGVGGIWQRIRGGKVRLLIAYKPAVHYRPRWDFPGIVLRSVERTLIANVDVALTRALATAR